MFFEVEVPNTTYVIKMKSQHLLELHVHSWYVSATKSADRNDKRDERGELETATYGHILSPCPFHTLKKS